MLPGFIIWAGHRKTVQVQNKDEYEQGGGTMEVNPRKALNQLMKGLEAMHTEQEAPTKALFSLLGAAYAHDSALGVKVKELISVGIAVRIRCEYCIIYHVYKALEAGAKRGEIMETAMIAVAMGGVPAMTYAATLVRNCLDEFEPDFQGG